MATSGGGLFGRPDFDIPELPRDITIISDDRLMQIFSEYVAWQNYAATEFAQAEVVEAKAEARVRYVEAQTMVGQWKSNDKVTVAKAALATDVQVEDARQEFLVAYAHRKMTQVILNNCERSAALISRELSRRIGRDPVERRNMRWNA